MKLTAEHETKFAIYLDPEGGACGAVNRASFDGHFTIDEVRDREDPQGQALFTGAVHALATGSVGCIVHEGGVNLYVERVES